jgi:hypothetical protein
VVRYVYRELAGGCVTLGVAAAGAAVTFGVRGLPREVPWRALLWLACSSLLVACGWALMEGRALRSALPLDDPDAVLPAKVTFRRHLVHGGYSVLLVGGLATTVVRSPAWTPDAQLAGHLSPCRTPPALPCASTPSCGPIGSGCPPGPHQRLDYGWSVTNRSTTAVSSAGFSTGSS